MPSTPSTSLRLELQATGEKLNLWGEDLNRVLVAVEQAIVGVLIKPLTGNVTLTNDNFVSNEARNATLIFTAGAGLAAAPTVTVPLPAKSWHVDNRCGYPITFTNGGATVTVPVGRQADVFSDGANLFMLEPIAAAAAVTEQFATQAATSAQSAASAAGTATTAKNAAVDNKNYAAEWATKAIDSLISTAAGGNGTTDYSSRHFASKAATSAAEAATSATEAAAKLAATSFTSMIVGTGFKTFSTQAGKAFGLGSRLSIAASNNPTNIVMYGRVSTYNGTSLVVNIDNAIGSGTFNSWTIRLAADRGEQGTAGNISSTYIQSRYFGA